MGFRFGVDLGGDGFQIPDEAGGGEEFEDEGGDVDLPPVEALAGREA